MPNPFAALTSELVQAGSIVENGLFVWQNHIYTVLSEKLIPAHERDEGKIYVRSIAAGWTKNPHDRWQFHLGNVEQFQADCRVAELLFNPNWQMPNQPSQPSGSAKRVTDGVRDMLAILEDENATEAEKDTAASTIVEGVAPDIMQKASRR